LTIAVNGQSNDSKLASHYFQKGDFEKASLYYSKLYQENPSNFHYEQLLKCHTGLLQYDDAEKLIRGHIRKNPGQPKFLVELGQLYAAQEEPDKAKKEYEKALKSLQPEPNQVRQLANAFIKADEPEMALETYERGEKLMKGAYPFFYEKANVQGMMGNVEAMIESYLDLIADNPGYLQTVQNSLNRYMDVDQGDKNAEFLREELLRRSQRNPDMIIFQEMLIWMYIQQNDLYSAMIQSKALDKRNDEGGERLLELARIAGGTGNWSVAKKCYDYVADLGETGKNYMLARVGAVQVMDRQFKEEKLTDKQALNELDGLYEQTINALGKTAKTIELVQNAARLKAYYLNDVPTARSMLEEALTIPGLSVEQQAGIKLDLGDLHVLQNDIWEASLYYSQVDLDFKYDILGHEARFRNARVSYYAGDFNWCQAQLDVLKASTSKLIANDAMELSLMITDNLGLDSNAVPLSAFSRAELLIFQHRFDEAIALLDSLEEAFPMHALGDNVLFQRYRIDYALAEYDSAATHLVELLDLYGLDMLADNALYELGILYEDKIRDDVKAQEYFERLLFEHPGSIFVVEARQRFRRLRGDDDIELDRGKLKPDPVETP
jgi:tetratricopeptide (TPR) repeat protein